MTLGENIAELMREKGIKGKELADILETSESYISEIKNDKQDPSLRKLREIAEALGSTEHELLKTYRINQDSKTGIAEDDYVTYYTDTEKEMLKRYRRLNEKNKIKIEGMVEMLLTEQKSEKEENKADKKGVL